MKKYFRISLFAALVASGPARAALFCVDAQELPAECIYDDPALCRQRARQLDGICSLNPDQAVIAGGFGFGSYCMVDASRMAICAYSDRDSCEKDAERNRSSVCVPNNKFGSVTDPFRYNPRVPY